MANIDPGLKFLATASPADLIDIGFESALGVEAGPGEPPRAKVLVEVEGNGLAALRDLGFVARTRAGAVVSGEIPIAVIDRLVDLPGLRRAEVSRVLGHELDLALTKANVTPVHGAGHTGAGVIVGIIDTGIDYQHPAFRRADGTTRILAIWDQRLRPLPGESNPAAFAYGVEYTQAAIDAALGAASPLAVVRHVDIPDRFNNFHGTHVAGIAAGNGEPTAASGGTLTFLGVAPEADLVVVANTRGRAQNERGLGDSADTLDAIQYILGVAAAAGRPVAINISQGDNIGPHDGSSLLEVGIDGLIAGAGQVLVKSAGNEGASDRHAQGTIAGGATQDVRFQVPPNTREVMIDLWYPGGDTIDIRLAAAGGGSSAVLTAPSTHTLTFANGNAGFVDLDLQVPGNNDNRTFIVLTPGSGMTVQSGIWTLQLRAGAIVDGRWHAWIQRHSAARFQAPFASRATTISIPGTSQAAITAGSFVSRAVGGTPVNQLSAFSSAGPTRDGRRAPTLAAPGEELTAPQPAPANFGGLSGTSMAAPMVTGTAALMLAIDPLQTAADVRQCLEQTAVLDQQTGPTPGDLWGAGKLDADAAVRCAGS